MSKTDTYSLAIRGTLKEPRHHKVFFDEQGIWLPIRNISKEYYKGPVFNFQTSDDTYTTPILIHNCGNSAYPRVFEKSKSWGPFTPDKDGKKFLLRYFSRIIDTLRSIKFALIPPFKPYQRLYKKEHPNADLRKVKYASYWKCYKKAEKFMKSNPPATEKELKEWDQERAKIIKKKNSNDSLGELSGKFKLQKQTWRGPIHIRTGPSRTEYHLLLKTKKGIEDFVTDRSPPTSGIFKEPAKKRWDAEGDIEPKTKVNPTKETPSKIEIVDEGKFRWLDQEKTLLKFEGDKLDGEYKLPKDPDSKIRILKKINKK